jgi:Protein of unknown function (DUF4256)
MKAQEKHQLLQTLQARFEKHSRRHPGVSWAAVQTRLGANADALRSLKEMEGTGGEPDVIGHQDEDGRYTFCDCAAESPNGRRSLCYDREALDARKEAKPASSAIEMAAAMSIEVLTEDEYRKLQAVGEFDLKTSSWIRTPAEVRKLGGALFGDRRYGRVFTYHNGAESYYSARGFRGLLRI